MKVPHKYRKALLIDIDGTVLEHKGDCKTQKPLKDAVEWVNKKLEEGYGIFFFTSRLPEEKEATEATLDKFGFKYHSVIYGKPYADFTTIIDDRDFDVIKVHRNKGVSQLLK